MTTQRAAPTLVKWPFILGDLLLLGLAWWIMQDQPHPLAVVPQLVLVGCVVLGAWLTVTPFLREHEARLRFAEADQLTTAAALIDDLNGIANQIRTATAQWQTVQESAGKTAATAKDLAERMQTDARALAHSLNDARDQEKAHLQLEVDKLRRAESDWLQSAVRVLDHVHALHGAALRSGQPGLIEQLGRFRYACYESVRRLGLVPGDAQKGDPFTPELHQLPDPEAQPEAGAVVEETLACGYTFQGQILRRPVVSVRVPPPAAAALDTTGLAVPPPEAMSDTPADPSIAEAASEPEPMVSAPSTEATDEGAEPIREEETFASTPEKRAAADAAVDDAVPPEPASEPAPEAIREREAAKAPASVRPSAGRGGARAEPQDLFPLEP